MKKNTIQFLLSMALLGLLETTNAQTTYQDDFSTDVTDYLTANLTGTIWNGVAFNTGTLSGSNTATNAMAKVENGHLKLTSSDGGFTEGKDDGLYLYRTIPAGNDFEMSIQLVGGNFPTFDAGVETFFNSAGLVARDVNHTSGNFIYTSFFELYAIHTLFKKVVAGVQEEQTTPLATYPVAQYSWMKLVKVGSMFTVYVSKDGIVWEATPISADFPALNSVNLEVGISQCNFQPVAPAPSAILDNFKLVVSPSLGLNDLSNTTSFNVHSSTKGVVIDNKSEKDLSSVKLYTIAGSLVYNENSLSEHNQQYEIPVNQSGVYIVEATIDGKRYTKKVMISE